MNKKYIEQYTEWEKEILNKKENLLYKYRGDIYRDILTIKNNQIYIPDLEKLNDPNESCLSLHSTFQTIQRMEEDVKKIKEFISKTKEAEEGHSNFIRHIKNMKRQLKNTAYKNGYFSLCKRFDIECLWAYYSNGHKGFCIEYDLNELIQSIKYKAIFEVKYTHERKCPNIDDLGEMIEEPITFLRDLTASKSKSWEKEEEVRIVSYKSGYADIHPTAIKSIYIGAKCPDTDKDFIIKSLKDMNLKFYQMKFNHDSFAMSCEPIITL